ncbi:type I polyketide synthase [Streptomyces sp. NPDC053542]|uniref:type I polyketide synthase n=1 Tax=Streptomyces sp. NPDC053542 TaxID=3365710 RepID=UPI0037D0101F
MASPLHQPAGAEAHDPPAVVGMACRLPGAASVAEFWRLLDEGRDAVGPAPEWRPAGLAPGGYIDGADRFDAGLFRMPAPEADATDPQQRLLLELCWEALEDARIAPDALRGSGTGVFVGAGSDDYAFLSRARGPEAATAYTLTGTARAFLANRVSYAFGLRGPSLTVDTGQSASLAAVHQAAAGLRLGEYDLALAGGVQLNLAAESEAAVRQLGALSPGGRCRTFDARADGIVRGEGGGVVVLKPLSRAVHDGDRIYCILLSSALNNDGGGESLTAPDAAAQRAVLSLAYRRAGVAPEDVAYVELHGTGTRVGDPVEAAALGGVLGRDRPAERPLLVGSVKTNIGHLEAAAGIAGFLKTALSIHHGRIPRSLHFEEPNPRIDLTGLRLRVCADGADWPRDAHRRVAGVSSFGLGGTNCHAVLAGPPPVGPGAAPERPAGTPADAAGPLPWVLSADSRAALRAQAARLADLLDTPRAPEPRTVARSLAVTRAVLRHRAAVLAAGTDDAVAGLRALAAGDSADRVLQGLPGGGRTAFLFPGQGMQRSGMGQRLYAAQPAFAAAFDEVAAALEKPLGRPLHDMMWRRDDWLDQLQYAQPALFALEVALYRLLESWGLVPDCLLGHSQGEIAVAHVTGVLSLADAAAFVVERGRLISGLPASGAMVALQADEHEVRPLLASRADRLDIAAVNSPLSLVVSGDAREVTRIADHFAGLGRRGRLLRISRAGHSPLMAPIQEELRAFGEGLTWHAPSGPAVVSSVTGRLAGPDDLTTPAYWAEHLCRTVRFAAGVRTLRDHDVRFFVEAGPGHGLSTMVGEADDSGTATLAAPLAGPDETLGVAELLGRAYLHGVPVDWRAVHGPGTALTDLPTYPFQRRRHWLGGAPPTPAAAQTVSPPDRPAVRRAAPVRDVLSLVTRTTDEVRGDAGGERVDPARTFRELGVDSRMALTLRGRLAEATGLALPATLLFDFPTPAELTAELIRRLPPTPSGPLVLTGDRTEGRC